MAREMKNSGVAWIGDIPSHWQISKIKYFYDCLDGKRVPVDAALRESGPYPYWGAGSIMDYVNDFLFNEELVLLGEDGAPFFDHTRPVAFLINGPVWANNHVHVLRPKKDSINSRFLVHWLNNVDYKSYINGSILNKPTQKNMDTIAFAVPPLDEQTRIADYLHIKCAEIDALLDKIRTSIEEYKKLKQAIITQAVTKGIRGDRPMKGSGIEWVKELPSEWELIPSKYLFCNSDERKHATDELLTASQKYGIISQVGFMERENTGIVLAAKGIENWKHVEPYNFIISLRSFQGGLEMSEISGCITWHYIVLKPLRPLHSFYYKWLFKSQLYIKALQRTCNFIRDGQDLRYSNFVQVPLFIPPMAEQKEIADFLNDRCAKIDALIQKKERLFEQLESYKKSLIYEYVTGKKEVPIEQEQQIQEIIVYPYFPAVLQVKSPRFAQAVLMSKVLDECRTKMGRVKLEKMMFVLENSIGFNFETEYVREAAGPLDKSIYACEKIISKKNSWFTIKKSKHGVSYQPTKDVTTYKKYYGQYFAEYESAINHVINTFRDFDADQAEIIATLYSAWNDFIIDKKKYTDDDIAEEVLNNWNDTKKRFPKDVWLRAIQKMRELDLVPHGYGRHTIIKGDKNLGKH